MKVEIVIDEEYQETYVKIFTDKYNKEIENLEKSLVNINNNVILGFKDDDAFVLDLKNIYRFLQRIRMFLLNVEITPINQG